MKLIPTPATFGPYLDGRTVVEFYLAPESEQVTSMFTRDQAAVLRRQSYRKVQYVSGDGIGARHIFA